MDFLPIAVLILFVLLGGIIAVIADELGRRIGKKRLVLHKRIRPKHTARIVNFLTGMLITLITMGLIAASSEEMRTLLTRGRLALRDLTVQRDRLEKDLDNLRSQNEQLREDKARLTGENAAALQRTKTANAQAASAEAKQSAAEKRAGDADKRARVALADYHKTTIQLEGREKDLKTVQDKLAKRQKEFAKLQGDYNYVYSEYKSLTQKNDELTVKNNDLQNRLNDLTGQLKDAGDALKAKNSEIEGLTSLQASLQKEVNDLAEAVKQSRSELAQLKDELTMANDIAKTGAAIARFSTLVYSAGEELTRITIPPGTSKDQARARIEMAISEAKLVAKARGVEPWNGIEYAGMIEDLNTHATVNTQKDLLAAELAGLPSEQVLIAYSAMNTFGKESVILGFAHRENPVVYQPGQMIAEVRVNAREPAAKIMESLNGLAERIRKRALGDNMIPIQRGDMSLGSASPEDIVMLYDKIRESGGSVRVQARAKRLTRAGDPLLLDFEVR